MQFAKTTEEKYNDKSYLYFAVAILQPNTKTIVGIYLFLGTQIYNGLNFMKVNPPVTWKPYMHSGHIWQIINNAVIA